MATNAQLETRIKALEAWRTTATTTLNALAGRIATLEARPTGGTVDLAPLTARVTKLETTPCGQESRIKTLENDHIPTP